MATISQIRGMLLEEALLYLLRLSGYRTVEKAVHNGVHDETLNDGRNGLEVLGRGEKHQIDAVADLIYTPPFSNPQRLLLEAKYQSKRRTGILVIRNAVGVRKDVDEYWFSRDGVSIKSRYCYQYAVFSNSGYTANAERYAYAHNIYLISLENNLFIQPIIQSISNLTSESFEAKSENKIYVDLSYLRREIRRNLQNYWQEEIYEEVDGVTDRAIELINDFYSNCMKVRGAVLGMIANQFPIFLIPAPDTDISYLEANNVYSARIKNCEGKWYLSFDFPHDGLRYSPNKKVFEFSFDLPPNLFYNYVTNQNFCKSKSLNEFYSDIQTIITSEEQVRYVTFKLDENWFPLVLDELNRRRQDEEQ